MRKFLGWCAAGLAALALSTAAPARADLSFGYEARYVGMGGAGLAIIDNPTQAALLNPAALSLRPTNFAVQWPNLGVRISGAGIGKAFDEFTSGSLGGAQALDVARALGEQPTTMDASMSFGLAASVIDVRASSLATLQVAPGYAFTRWARADQDLGTWLSNQADFLNTFANVHNTTDLNNAINTLGLNAQVYGAASVAPSIGIGMRVPRHLAGRDLGDLRVGVRLKPTRTYYSHWTISPDVSNITAGDFTAQGFNAFNKLGVQAVRGSEMGSKDALDETSLGADLGVLWQPGQLPYTTLAVTVTNLLEPSFTLPAGSARAGEKLMPRTFSAGAAVQIPIGLTLAADVIDFTEANGKMQFRAGAELRPRVPVLRWVALRAGYNGPTGLTAGIGIGGFGLAYAAKTPVVASQTFNF